MLYLIVEHFRNHDPRPVYARFRAVGRLAPAGVRYVNSWVTDDLSRCYQVMECDERASLDQWLAAWSDLVEFDVIPVMTSAEAANAVGLLDVPDAEPAKERWAEGDAYDRYVGRWSRAVAAEFLAWLDEPRDRSWLDVGCGTGALTHAIAAHAAPRLAVGVDRSLGFVVTARAVRPGTVAAFAVADARALPLPSDRFDLAVSGLVLNFLPEPADMIIQMKRAVRPGGRVAVYVWDYAGRMQLIRVFWDAVVDLDPAMLELDEGRRFPLCRPDPLRELFTDAGLHDVQVSAIDVPTVFRDFDEYWIPFLGGQGPAPAYAVSLDAETRGALCALIRSRLPAAKDGSISLVARAWAVSGRV